MSEVAAKSPLPILCKDFVIDEAQIDLAYAMGADMVLLIVRILGRERLQALHAHAAGLGMTCLVEVHKERELDEISGLDLPMVGSTRGTWTPLQSISKVPPGSSRP